MRSQFEMDMESGKKLYHEGWHVSDCKKFSDADVKAVESAEVVAGDFGLQVKFHFAGGGHMFYGISQNSNIDQNSKIDPKDLYWVTLSAVGQKPCKKVSDIQEAIEE
jgi:hypothetical protein